MLKIEVITDLTDEPVSLAEVKAMLRITGSGHDSVILSMITSARKYMEKALGKSLGEKTLKLTCDDEYKEYDLPYGPNQVITDEDEDDDGNYVYTYTTGYKEVPQDYKEGIIIRIKMIYDGDDLAVGIPDRLREIIVLNTNCPML